MALTTVPANTRVVRWKRKFYREYIRENRFAKYIGDNENSPIQMNEDLSKDIGEYINFSLVNRLTNQTGTTGYNVLEGNEERASIRNFRIRVDRIRHAVVHDTLDEQYSAIDLVEAKNAILKDWATEQLRDRILTALLSVSTDGLTHTSYATASAGQRNTWNQNNSDRVLYGNAIANYNATMATALANVDNVNDNMTRTNLSLMKDVAKQTIPKVRPIKIRDEEEWFVVLMGTPNFRNLQNDLATINQNAWERSKGDSNPLYTGGDLIWDGMIIREVPEIVSLGTVGASSTNVYPVYLFGAQSVAYAIAQRPTMIKNVTDYGAKIGAGIQFVDGIAKSYFGSGVNDGDTPKQNLVTGFFAATP